MVVGAQLTAGKCVSFSFEVFLLLLGICFVCSVVVLLRSAAAPFFLQLN
jgi:hypothetical protein